MAHLLGTSWPTRSSMSTSTCTSIAGSPLGHR